MARSDLQYDPYMTLREGELSQLPWQSCTCQIRRHGAVLGLSLCALPSSQVLVIDTLAKLSHDADQDSLVDCFATCTSCSCKPGPLSLQDVATGAIMSMGLIGQPSGSLVLESAGSASWRHAPEVGRCRHKQRPAGRLAEARGITNHVVSRSQVLAGSVQSLQAAGRILCERPQRAVYGQNCPG